MSARGPVQVIAVSGGKGGVGKSNIAVNLAVAMAGMGRRVAVLDGDLGLANVDVLLGLAIQRNLEDVVAGECALADILVEGPAGLRVVPAASGSLRMASLSGAGLSGLINAFSDLADELDVLIVDTAPGISEPVVTFLLAAQEVLLVICDEPTSIADAYGLIKLMNRNFGVNRFRVVANQVRNDQEGQHLFEKLTRVTERFLDVALQYEGAVPYDDNVKKAVQRQRAFVDVYPRARASQAVRTLAERADNWPLPSSPRGHLEFFVERLVGA